ACTRSWRSCWRRSPLARMRWSATTMRACASTVSSWTGIWASWPPMKTSAVSYSEALRMQPTEIKLHKRSAMLELAWADGRRSELPAEFLRVYSPSAEVRGHGQGQEVLQTGKRRVGIRRLEPVGNYAVRLHFDDGHDTGIYSWEYLHELAE